MVVPRVQIPVQQVYHPPAGSKESVKVSVKVEPIKANLPELPKKPYQLEIKMKEPEVCPETKNDLELVKKAKN